MCLERLQTLRLELVLDVDSTVIRVKEDLGTVSLSPSDCNDLN